MEAWSMRFEEVQLEIELFAKRSNPSEDDEKQQELERVKLEDLYFMLHGNAIKKSWFTTTRASLLNEQLLHEHLVSQQLFQQKSQSAQIRKYNYPQFRYLHLTDPTKIGQPFLIRLNRLLI